MGGAVNGANTLGIGAGGVWATERSGGEPALLVELGQSNLAEVRRRTLPPGASPGAVSCVVAGGGLVYVTDGVGAVDTVQP